MSLHLCSWHAVPPDIIAVLGPQCFRDLSLSSLQACTSGRSTFLDLSLSVAHQLFSLRRIRTQKPFPLVPSSPRPRPKPRPQIRTRTSAEPHLLPPCQLPPHRPLSRASPPTAPVPPPRSTAEPVQGMVVVTAPEARPLAMDAPLITTLSKQAQSTPSTDRLLHRRRRRLRPLSLSRVRIHLVRSRRR